jgi:UDP-N-acetylmuramate dehydrogenase
MLKVYKNKDLSLLNTFGIQASAKYFIEFTESSSLREFIANPPHYYNSYFVLGGGSNVLFKDNFSGCILHPINKGIRVVVEDTDTVIVEVQAGEEWDVFVQWAVSHKLGGIENLAGIPGRVGASPVQNIGAYGSEAKDTIVSVETIDLDSGEVSHLSNKECTFGYRDSIFKHELKSRRLILSVLFKLTKKHTPNFSYPNVLEALGTSKNQDPAAISRAIKSIRESKIPQPWDMASAGSFFKNPVVTSAQADELKIIYPDIPIFAAEDNISAKLAAGWLIEQAGWKGAVQGKAGVHEKQALVLVNLGGATPDEILELADSIRTSVAEKFGVQLEPEVNII